MRRIEKKQYVDFLRKLCVENEMGDIGVPSSCWLTMTPGNRETLRSGFREAPFDRPRRNLRP